MDEHHWIVALCCLATSSAAFAQPPNLDPNVAPAGISRLLNGAEAEQLDEIAKLAAENPPSKEDIAGAAAAAALSERALDIGPLRLTFGPTEDGFFGSTLKGEGRHVFAGLSTQGVDWTARRPGSLSGYTTSLGYLVDAGWAGGEKSNNNASITLRPGFDWTLMKSVVDYRSLTTEEARTILKDSADRIAQCRETFSVKLVPVRKADCVTLVFPKPVMAIGTFADLRYRYGYFEQDDVRVSVNQAIFGAGLRATFFTPGIGWMASWPQISAGWYTVEDTESSEGDVPKGIEADAIKVAASLKFAAWNRSKIDGRQDYWLRFYLDAEGTKPTQGDDKDWQGLVQVQVLLKTDSQFKPALTYRDGKEQGLDYDKQVLLGLLYELVAEK